MIIRRFENGDETAVAELIQTTLRVSNSRDYPADFIEESVKSHNDEGILEQAQEAHFYVALDGENIIGCGGITGYWGSETESYILSVFVNPEYQGMGIGRRIVETLEEDAYFKRAWRTEIGASITAVPFYRHMGYSFKNGVEEVDEFGTVRMEKRNGTVSTLSER